MVDAGRAFLKWKQEAPTMTTPPDLLDAMVNKLFTTACLPVELPRSIADTTATPRWSSSQIIVNDNGNDDSINANGRMMLLTSAPNLGIQGGRTMLLVRAILSKGIRILIDIGATHNVIDSNIACIIGLAECRITTTVLVGSDTKLAC